MLCLTGVMSLNSWTRQMITSSPNHDLVHVCTDSCSGPALHWYFQVISGKGAKSGVQ
jgi:hypothetical protein